MYNKIKNETEEFKMEQYLKEMLNFYYGRMKEESDDIFSKTSCGPGELHEISKAMEGLPAYKIEEILLSLSYYNQAKGMREMCVNIMNNRVLFKTEE